MVIVEFDNVVLLNDYCALKYKVFLDTLATTKYTCETIVANVYFTANTTLITIN